MTQLESPRRWGYSSAEWKRLIGFYGTVAVLHIGGLWLLLSFAAHDGSLIAVGCAAYLFGLRHAFDADHIVAVDDTVRFLLQSGKRPLGVGFFFSLGHSTIVFALTLATVFVAAYVRTQMPALQDIGGLIGAGISGIFLWLIGMLNLAVLLDVLGLLRSRRMNQPAHLDSILARRGFLNRLLGGRLRIVRESWQMYPIGILFGLGFDTASEVGLLAISAVASAHQVPPAAILSLPLLFAAGMCAMDTTDGVIMTRAYGWALGDPQRRIIYNAVVTGLSVVLALAVGSLECLQVLSRIVAPRGALFRALSHVDLAVLGCGVVGLFLIAWGGSMAYSRYAPVEIRSRLRGRAGEAERTASSALNAEQYGAAYRKRGENDAGDAEATRGTTHQELRERTS